MAKKAELKARLTLDKTIFDRALRSAKVAARDFQSAMGDAAKKGVKYLEVAVLVSAAALAYGVKKAYDLGAEMNDMSKKTGIAVDQLLILNRVAKDNGVDDLSISIKKMQVTIASAINGGTGPAAQALDALGLSAAELDRKLPVEQLRLIGERINAIQSPATKTAAAVAIFGRAGQQMLAIFADGGAFKGASDSIGRQAKILKDNAESFHLVSIRLSHIGEKLQGFFVGVAERILPLMNEATKRLDALDLASQGEKFGDGIKKAVDYLAGAFANPGKSISLIGGILKEAFIYADDALEIGLEKAAMGFLADMTEYTAKIADGMTASLIYGFNRSISFFKDGWRETVFGMGVSLINAFDRAGRYLSELVTNALRGSFGSADAGKKAASDIAEKNKGVLGNTELSFEEILRRVSGSNPLYGEAGSIRTRGRDNAAMNFKEAADRFHSAVVKFEEGMKPIQEKGKKIVDKAISEGSLPGVNDPNSAWHAQFKPMPKHALAVGAAATMAALGLYVDPHALESVPHSGVLGDNNGLKVNPFDNKHSGLNAAPYGYTPLMRASERRGFENEQSALGVIAKDSRENALSRGAYSVTRGGDFRRSRNVELQKEREAQKNMATNIANIATNTAGIRQDWGNSGNPSGGN